MEEKERYIVGKGENISIVDNYQKVIFNITTKKLQDLLNRKDKRIKELEETNKVLSNELTKNSILKQDYIETCCGISIFEIPNEPKAITELKQLQKMFERDSKFNGYGSSCETSQYYYEYVTKRISELTHQHEDKGENK